MDASLEECSFFLFTMLPVRELNENIVVVMFVKKILL